MARPRQAVDPPARRRPADHPRLCPVILLLFMYLAPEVFLRPFQYTTFLSTLPPVMLLAIGLTFVIGAGEIDLLSRRHRLLRLSSSPSSSRKGRIGSCP